MIKIEVTGNSIPEVADKLLAIGANLKGSAIVDGARAAVKAMNAMAAEAPITPVEAPVDPVMPEVAEMAAAPEPAAPAEEPASSTTADTPTDAPAAAAPAELTFDADVAPYVLQVVKEKGKPAAEEILSQFGVAKASLLDPAQWPELVAALKDAL